jgi:hypothetical protein
MKTERRHELQTNVLADWLGKKTEAIRPYFLYIIMGMVAVFVVGIVVTVTISWQYARTGEGWADYFAAATADPIRPGDLSLVASNHPGTLPAVWATLKQADLELSTGIRALYTARGESIEAIGKAKKLYALVEDSAVGQPDLLQAAQFGMAQAFEAEGDAAKAKDYYQLAIASDKDSSIASHAQVRLEQLDDDATEWLAWFAKATPRLSAQSSGFPGGFPDGFPDGFPGGAFPGLLDDDLDVPRDLTELPGRPQFSIPLPFEATNERDSSFPISGPDVPPPVSTGTEPEGTESEGTESEGTESEGSVSEGSVSEGSVSEGSEPESPKPEATGPATSTPGANADEPVGTPAGDGAASP